MLKAGNCFDKGQPPRTVTPSLLPGLLCRRVRNCADLCVRLLSFDREDSKWGARVLPRALAW